MDGTEPIDRAAPPSPESSGFERDVLPLAGDLERFAIRYTNNSVDAEDLVQETLLKAFKASHKLGDKTYCKQWLLTIMRNTWIDKYRAKSRRPAENLVADISDHHEGTAAHNFARLPPPSNRRCDIHSTPTWGALCMRDQNSCAKRRTSWPLRA